MNSQIARVWFLSFALASVLAFVGLRAQPQMWGFYIQLPGTAAGLFVGFAAASRAAILTRTLAIGTSIALNTLCYYSVYRLFVRMTSRGAPRREEAQP